MSLLSFYRVWGLDVDCFENRYVSGGDSCLHVSCILGQRGQCHRLFSRLEEVQSVIVSESCSGTKD